MVGRLEIHPNYVILAKYRKVLHEHSKMLPLEPNSIPRNHFSTLCKLFDQDKNSEAQKISEKVGSSSVNLEESTEEL